MKIGYQGDIGSNAEAAARRLAVQAGIADPEFIPLFGSENVLSAILRNQVDHGVVAIRNSQGGWVSETYEAFKHITAVPIARTTLHIHHCLFKLDESIPDSQIIAVASHAQALKQTKETRAKLFPTLDEMPLIDTAIGARWLSEGKLGKGVAVICRQSTGERYGLTLMQADIEDNKENYTDFVMF